MANPPFKLDLVTKSAAASPGGSGSGFSKAAALAAKGVPRHVPGSDEARHKRWKEYSRRLVLDIWKQFKKHIWAQSEKHMGAIKTHLQAKARNISKFVRSFKFDDFARNSTSTSKSRRSDNRKNDGK